MSPKTASSVVFTRAVQSSERVAAEIGVLVDTGRDQRMRDL